MLLSTVHIDVSHCGTLRLARHIHSEPFFLRNFGRGLGQLLLLLLLSFVVELLLAL
jgi:hypothetical protein